MKRSALSFILIATLIAVSGCRRETRELASVAGPEAHFSLVLEHSPTGWAAHCDSGCVWKDVTMQCSDCKVRIDANGIYESTAPMTSSEFAFVLDDGNGLSAHAVKGTRWLDLSWNCAAAVCRCRLNEQGVHVPA